LPIAVALLALSFPASVRATPTDPFLALRNAVVIGGPTQVLRVEGSFHADDLAQVPFALQILVRDLTSGTVYLRIDPFGVAVHGDDAALADGLQTGEVAGLLAGGSPEAWIEIVERSADRIDLVLPSGFPSGPAEIQLFVWNDGDPVLSNTLPVQLGGTP
jgi:hypothetical protein